MVSGSPLSAEKWRADHPVLCGGTQDDGTIVHKYKKSFLLNEGGYRDGKL